MCETGGARRCWLAGLEKVTKRYLLQAAARNLGLILRKLFGTGTPRGQQKDAEGKTAFASFAQIAMNAFQIATNALRAARNAIRGLHNKTFAPRPQIATAT